MKSDSQSSTGIAELIERMETFADHGCSPNHMLTAQELIADALLEIRRRTPAQRSHGRDAIARIIDSAAITAERGFEWANRKETAFAKADEIVALYAAPQPASNADMARLSASEAACYRWREDTAEHRAMRAAFEDGAAHAAAYSPNVPSFMEVVRSRWNFEENEFDAIEKALFDPKCAAALSLPSTDREAGK